MKTSIRDIASMYQKATGEGLPFSEDDGALLKAMERSWRETTLKLRILQHQHNQVLNFIETYKEQR